MLTLDHETGGKHLSISNHTTSIPPLCKDDFVYTKEADMAYLMDNFFVEQIILDKTNAPLPTDIHPTENNLKTTSSSPYKIESILKSLQIDKALGPE